MSRWTRAEGPPRRSERAGVGARPGTALADPEPDPPGPGPVAATPDPGAPSPAVVGAARGTWRRGCTAARSSRRRSRAAAAAAAGASGLARTGSDAVRRRAAVPAADVQPGQRVDGRGRQADHHQLRGADRGPAMAERAIHISSIPPVPGKFYWLTPSQVRWRPLAFWPAHTAVNIDAAGAKSSFRTGDSLVATADDATHQMTITRNGTVVQTFPMSMGMAAGGHQTANGTYYVLEKMASVVMDSSTYGVPVSSANGYKVTVSRCRADRQQRQLRAQRAVVGRRSGQARRQPRLHQPEPHPTRSGSSTTSAAVTRSS